MSTTARAFFVGLLIGAAVVATANHFLMRESKHSAGNAPRSASGGSTNGIDDPFAEASDKGVMATGEDPFAIANDDGGWMGQLEKLSGKWISADGQQNAEIDFRTLRFKDMGQWADLDNQTYLLGQEMQFLSKGGFYSVCQTEASDSLRIIKKDLMTDDVYGFTLYRSDFPRARARAPLSQVEPPPEIRIILAAIPKIQQTDRKDDVLRVMKLDEEKMEILEGSSSLGETDRLFNLGIDDHWMLKLGYKRPRPDSPPEQTTFKRFQLVRGYVDDVRRDGALDVEQFIYPYFVFDKIVTGPTSTQQVAPSAGDKPSK